MLRDIFAGGSQVDLLMIVMMMVLVVVVVVMRGGYKRTSPHEVGPSSTSLLQLLSQSQSRDRTSRAWWLRYNYAILPELLPFGEVLLQVHTQLW
jgi:hypothetical protein